MNLTTLHNRFLSIVPLIERIARHKLRHIIDHDTRADAVAEVVAVCWQWFQRLAEKGKDATRFSARLAYLATRFVACGRRVWGSESLRDPLSPRARRRAGFRLQQLQEHGNYDDPTWQEALIDNTQTPVPDQAAFRQDFPRWLRRLGRRNRRVAEKMLLGERTMDLSRKFGLTQGRVSQLRREFEADWRQFHGEGAAAKQEAVAA
ncbi:MAG: hypothetical protein AB7K24_11320 [Gemmataceae bacterium]